MAKPQGKCIFCGGFRLTKEHMWADWLREYIPRTLPNHSESAVVAKIGAPDEERITTRTGDPHSRRIRCVCGTCNNGWMSRLQEAAKPFLVPLLTGAATKLHRRAQTLIAAWTAMMVMVAEHSNSDMLAIPQSDRDYLYVNQKAPAHWRIWVGRHSRKVHPLFSHRCLPFTSKEEFERLGGEAATIPANTNTTTICLGKHLLIHVMASQVAWNILRRWPLPKQVAAGLDQIWPVRVASVGWPNGSTLTDDGIALVANEFHDKAVRFLTEKLAHSSS